jgi:hypothetical protein
MLVLMIFVAVFGALVGLRQARRIRVVYRVPLTRRILAICMARNALVAILTAYSLIGFIEFSPFKVPASSLYLILVTVGFFLLFGALNGLWTALATFQTKDGFTITLSSYLKYAVISGIMIGVVMTVFVFVAVL